jgi:cyclohexa-1,5-dienecarbonyl-CoA hydratase
MAYEHIEVSLENGLGAITLNRPPVNVLNIAMMEEINKALDGFQEDKDLKAVLFNAKGKCFSAGVDVGDHMGDAVHKMVEVFHGMFRRMDNLGVLTVASVYGSCLGGGCELAIFSDLVIADESAKLGQPEIQVGVFPPIAAQIMPRIIGRKAAMDLIMSGRIISAQEALQMGLVNKVVKEGELEDETSHFLKPYLKLSAEVLRLTKKAVMAGLRDDLESSLKVIEGIYLDELIKTHDAEEGLKAFLEKRKAVWKNE